jgi:hypothetical protein
MKCLSFTRAVNLPVLGLIENMSGYVCPCCGETSNVFSTNGGADMARREGLALLGTLPVDTELVTLLDAAEPDSTPESDSSEKPHLNLTNGVGTDGSGSRFELWERYAKTSSALLFNDIVTRVVQALSNSTAT